MTGQDSFFRLLLLLILFLMNFTNKNNPQESGRGNGKIIAGQQSQVRSRALWKANPGKIATWVSGCAPRLVARALSGNF
jgi:hypothetical protein